MGLIMPPPPGLCPLDENDDRIFMTDSEAGDDEDIDRVIDGRVESPVPTEPLVDDERSEPVPTEPLVEDERSEFVPTEPAASEPGGDDDDKRASLLPPSPSVRRRLCSKTLDPRYAPSSIGTDVRGGCEDSIGDDCLPLFAEVQEEGHTYFYPYGLTIAGMQHVVDNLNHDTHEKMEHWDWFYAILKQFEALLRNTERRDRLIWTCFRHTSHARFEHLYERFSASLYEQRWREVVNFLGKLMKLLPSLILAWDQAKFESGVDSSGEARPVQARRQQQQESGQGMIQYRPQVITEAFRSGKFCYYAAMALRVEQIPTALTQEMEVCVCHKALLEILSKHEQKVMFTPSCQCCHLLLE